MSNDVLLSIDEAQLDRDTAALVGRYEKGATTAVGNVTKRLERRLEALTQAGVGGRLWRAWASRLYRNGDKTPAGIVYIKGGARSRGAMTFFSMPGTVRSGTGQFLAVPLPAAGPQDRLRGLSPKEWLAAHPGMRLQVVWRPGRTALLVAVGTIGRAGTFRAAGSRQTAGGRVATVPIFELISAVPFRNTVSVAPLVGAAQAELPGEYVNLVSASG